MHSGVRFLRKSIVFLYRRVGKIPQTTHATYRTPPFFAFPVQATFNTALPLFQASFTINGIIKLVPG